MTKKRKKTDARISKKHIALRSLIGAGLIATSLISSPVSAADWSGQKSSNWFDNLNWQSNLVPGVSEDARIGVAGQVNSFFPVISGLGTIVNSNELYVGYDGSGTLKISEGGSVSANINSYIGYKSDSNGVVTVSGDGSQWTIANVLRVGDNGSGTLDISGGGSVTTNKDSFIGYESDGVGSVTVSGDGSQWNTAEFLTIGASVSGSGTLGIYDGGSVTNTDGYVGGYLYIGGSGGTTPSMTGHGVVTVSGDRSQWTNTEYLVVGVDGSGKLDILAGGSVSNVIGYIGYSDDTTGVVTVSGNGSQWTNTGTLTVGIDGSGRLDIYDGGRVSNTDGIIGSRNDGDVTVSGDGSQWTNSGILTVGRDGSGTLLAEDGGMVRARQVVGKGNMYLDSGTLQALAANTAFINFTGTGTFELGSGGGTIDSDVYDIGAASAISGTGSLTKAGAGTLTLTTANTYTGDTTVATGTLTLNGAGSITGIGSVDIAEGATFRIDRTTGNSGNYNFANPLTGSGRLSVELVNNSNIFSFDSSAGTAFIGTVALGTSTFDLSGDNTAALTNATLVVGTGNLTTVGIGEQTIGGLGFDGGTLIFDAQAPATTEANGTIKVTEVLDAAGSGTVQIIVPPSFSTTPPVVPTELSLTEQDHGNVIIKLVDASGSGVTVNGEGVNLRLVDQDGTQISKKETVALVNNTGGPTVATGHYDYRLSTGPDEDGLYVNYGLNQIELSGKEAGVGALVVSPRDGATGSAADLSALLTGVGDLAIATKPGDYVSLSNSKNEYTGTTYVRSGALVFGNDNVLGETENLVLDAGTVVDMAGYSQSVGALNTAADSRITVSGTLTIDSQRNGGNMDGGGIESGTLYGDGPLVIAPSIVHVNGVQDGYSGLVTVKGGSQLVLNAAAAFDNSQGIMLKAAADTLTFADESTYNPAWTSIAAGTMRASLDGSGSVQVQDGSDIELAGDNGNFAGRFEIAADSVLRASQAQQLGTASIENDGTFVATANTDSDWTLSSLLTGTGTLVKDGDGILRAGSSLSGFNGLTQVNVGTLQFGEGSTAGTIGGRVEIATGATLAGIGTVAGNVLNSGTVAPGLNAFGTITIAGDYAGNNGFVRIGTQLGDDSSATDKLIVTGDVSGNTSVIVTNRGGLGDQTVNGIQIIEIGGASPDDAFTLAGDYVTKDGRQAVIGGAYVYTLQHNSQNDPTGGNWYLTSEPEQRYHPGAPVYEQYPQVLAMLNTLPTLQQRVGNRYWSAQQSNASGSVANNDDVWGRIERGRTTSNPAITDSGAKREVDLWRLQTGIDFPLKKTEQGQLIGGVNFSYGRANADINSGSGNGKVKSNAYSAGATLTWYKTNGVYADGQAQLTWLSSDISSAVTGHTLTANNNGFGYAMSIETGKRNRIGDNLYVTPQIQLSYAHTNFNSFRDTYETRVSLDGGNSLKGRLGIALERETNWQTGGGEKKRSYVYGIVNLTNEFLGSSSVDVGGVKFHSRDERVRAGVGIGGTYEWQDGKYALYGAANIDSSVKNFGDSYALSGVVGLKMRW